MQNLNRNNQLILTVDEIHGRVLCEMGIFCRLNGPTRSIDTHRICQKISLKNLVKTKQIEEKHIFEGLPIHRCRAKNIFNTKYLQGLKFNKCVNHKSNTADIGDTCIDF